MGTLFISSGPFIPPGIAAPLVAGRAGNRAYPEARDGLSDPKVHILTVLPHFEGKRR